MRRISRRTGSIVVVAAILQLVAAGPFAQQPAQEARQTQTDQLQQYVESLRRARDGLAGAGDFEAALEPAGLVIDALDEADDASAAGDKVMLSMILVELARYEEAETTLLEAIESLQDEDGETAQSTVMPLQLLGRTYLRAGQFPQAITALNEARAVARRNTGLFDVAQASVIDDLTTAHLGLGDTMTARDLQIERLQTAQRQFGDTDPRVIPFHHHLAGYYERSRLLASAREQFDAALAIALAHDDAEQTLAALRGAVAIDLQQRGSPEDVERLRAAVTAAEVSAHERGLAHAVLGDAAILEENGPLAELHYAEAWALLAAGGEVDPAVYFADPAVIRFIPPANDVDLARRTLPWSWGTIVMEFDVDERGSVENINGVGAQLMKPVLANLTVDDMTAIVAYLASVELPPAPTDPQ